MALTSNQKRALRATKDLIDAVDALAADGDSGFAVDVVNKVMSNLRETKVELSGGYRWMPCQREGCTHQFEAERLHARFCSDACRQAAFRDRQRVRSST